MVPLSLSLAKVPSVADALNAFSTLPRVCLLESAKLIPSLGRYSFLMADPFGVSEFSAESGDPFQETKDILARCKSETLGDLPPFQGGAAGLLSYELGHYYEKIPKAKFQDFPIPNLSLGFYDVVLAWDHERNQAWLISHGWPEREPKVRQQRAQMRLEFFRDLLESHESAKQACTNSWRYVQPIQPKSIAYPSPFGEQWSGNFSREQYRDAVARAIEYIYAGDIFQVNLSQRWLHPATCSSLELYQTLRQVNPAPFAAYIDLGQQQLLSASPERFLRMQDRQVETRPIKGTRSRSTHPILDLYIGDSLSESRKDRAENLMIVDLLRNDLSRVCEPDSVRVTQLCEVERYQYVLHLVSAVEGKLQEPNTAMNLIEATFPGGSITGAPKIRAMEIISELEPTTRGAYCGSLGYLGFDGTMDWNIAIRTITASAGWWQVQAGGGIVADSVPDSEEIETWHKAEGLVKAIEAVRQRKQPS
jgi:para-aminobenzoate synthetase component 1